MVFQNLTTANIELKLFISKTIIIPFKVSVYTYYIRFSDGRHVGNHKTTYPTRRIEWDHNTICV